MKEPKEGNCNPQMEMIKRGRRFEEGDADQELSFKWKEATFIYLFPSSLRCHLMWQRKQQ